MRTNDFRLPLFSWPLAACLMVAVTISIVPGCERGVDEGPGAEVTGAEESKPMVALSSRGSPPATAPVAMELPGVDETGFELFFEDALRLPHSEDPNIDQLALGQAALDKGEHGAAIEAFRKAAFDTETYAAFFGLARAARIAGDFDLAIEASAAAARADPTAAEPLVMAARLSLSAGDLEMGLTFIDRAIGREPTRADAHNVRGRLWMAKEQYHRAQLSFDRAVELDPSFVWAWNNKGYVHLLTGRYEDAVDALETAVSLSPVTAYMHNNLGLAYEKSGRVSKAMAAFGEALALRPRYVNAIINLERVGELPTAVAGAEREGPHEREDGSLEFVPGG